jgi:hypothetical protein
MSEKTHIEQQAAAACPSERSGAETEACPCAAEEQQHTGLMAGKGERLPVVITAEEP